MHLQSLPADYALVLQQINEDGEEDFTTLAETLRFERSRLSHIIESLHHKGLLIIHRANHFDIGISLSSKGKHLLRYMWPESGLSPSY